MALVLKPAGSRGPWVRIRPLRRRFRCHGLKIRCVYRFRRVYPFSWSTDSAASTDSLVSVAELNTRRSAETVMVRALLINATQTASMLQAISRLITFQKTDRAMPLLNLFLSYLSRNQLNNLHFFLFDENIASMPANARSSRERLPTSQINYSPYRQACKA